MTPVVPWGYRALIDLTDTNQERTTAAEPVRAWVRDLVDTLGMRAYGPARVERFGVGRLTGITVQQLIETSNIDAHFNDIDGSGYVNVFSCRPYDLDKVIEQIDRWLHPATIHAQLFDHLAGRFPILIDTVYRNERTPGAWYHGSGAARVGTMPSTAPTGLLTSKAPSTDAGWLVHDVCSADCPGLTTG